MCAKTGYYSRYQRGSFNGRFVCRWLFGGGDPRAFTGREFSEFAQLQIPKAGLFDSKRFRYFLRRHLRTKNIEDLQIPMVIVATDLDNGESMNLGVVLLLRR